MNFLKKKKKDPKAPIPRFYLGLQLSGVFLVLLCGLSSFLPPHLFSTPSSERKKNASHSVYHYHTGTPLPSAQTRSLLTRLLEKGTPSLAQLAQTMQNQTQISTLHLFESAPNQITLSLVERRPLLSFAENSRWFLMSDGAICPMKPSEIRAQLPLLIGGASPPRKEAASRPCEPATTETNNLVLDTQKIQKELSLHHISLFQDITYDSYQGYTLSFPTHKMIAHVGKAPFGKKISRLHQVMEKMPDTPLEVDLDFENKAFIKEETPPP